MQIFHEKPCDWMLQNNKYNYLTVVLRQLIDGCKALNLTVKFSLYDMHFDTPLKHMINTYINIFCEHEITQNNVIF